MSSYGQQQHASSTHNVMQLNNWLQVNGGTRRLTWGEHRFGPEHCPLWRAAALIDNIEFGVGEGPTRGDARERAAYNALCALMSQQAQRYGRH